MPGPTFGWYPPEGCFAQMGTVPFSLLARRTVQVFCLLAFLGLLAVTPTRPEAAPSAVWKTCFLIDPLVLLATWLAAHAMPLALFGLPALAVALVVLAVFRRWVSAMGVLVAAVWIVVAGIVVSSLAGRLGVPTLLLAALGTIVTTALLGRAFCGSRSARWERSTPWQAACWGRWPANASPATPGPPGSGPSIICWPDCCVMALAGGHWGMLFDPIALLYRTTTTVVMPATQWAVEEGSTAIVQGEQALEGDSEFVPREDSKRGFRPSDLTKPIYHGLENERLSAPAGIPRHGADRWAAGGNARPQCLPAAVLVPVPLPARGPARRGGLAAALAPQRPPGELQPVRPVRPCVPWGRRHGARAPRGAWSRLDSLRMFRLFPLQLLLPPRGLEIPVVHSLAIAAWRRGAVRSIVGRSLPAGYAAGGHRRPRWAGPLAGNASRPRQHVPPSIDPPARLA